ncbi:MAG: type I methionyl aminopeptidase [Candidatus Yonathbacteria bacterium]|nr:type I methionyl aminopeptidase [Candidatus Yonathbacteria bacterium]
MSTIYTPEEIASLREGGKRLARILALLAERAIPGVSTAELDRYAEELIRAGGDTPSFKDYAPVWGGPTYPAALCASVNEVIVHGIPSESCVLKEGDIIGLDLGLTHDGLVSDSAITVAVGAIAPETQRLMDVTEKAMYAGIAAAKAGARVGDIGSVIEEIVLAGGFHIIEELAGHGVGHHVHEDPIIPNFGTPGKGPLLREGQVLAIEVMTGVSTGHGRQLKDGFTFITRDKSLSAHFEHTLVVTADGGEVMTKEKNEK